MTWKERVDPHDREIATIRQLILTGMKMRNQLAASQRETDRQLQAFIQSMRQAGNGHDQGPLSRN